MIKKFYKVVRADMTHRHYKYQEGLNICPDLDKNPRNSCSKGLHFCEKKHVLRFWDYGADVWEVSVPKGAIVIKDPDGDKYRTDKLILVRKLSKQEFINFMKNIPSRITKGGNLLLDDLKIPNTFKFPHVVWNLQLSNCQISSGVVFPKKVQDIGLSNCFLHNDVVLPVTIKNKIALYSTNVRSDTVLPKKFGTLLINGSYKEEFVIRDE